MVLWVIDTDVLVRAENITTQHGLNMMRMLTCALASKDLIAVDDDGYILKEYRRNLNPTAWVSSMILWFQRQSRIEFKKGDIPARLKSRLNDLRFDNDDHPFIAVASRTGSGKLVAEESDYTAVVRAALTKAGIAVLDCTAATQDCLGDGVPACDWVT